MRLKREEAGVFGLEDGEREWGGNHLLSSTDNSLRLTRTRAIGRWPTGITQMFAALLYVSYESFKLHQTCTMGPILSPPPSFSSSDQTSSIPISQSLHPRGRHDPSRFFSLVEHELSTALIEYRPRVYVDGTPVPMGLSGNAVIIATASISRFKFGFVPRVISSCESDGGISKGAMSRGG